MKRPVGSLPPSKPPTGPAPLRRPVCAPRRAAVIPRRPPAKETTHVLPLVAQIPEFPFVGCTGPTADTPTARAAAGRGAGGSQPAELPRPGELPSQPVVH